MNLTLNHSVSTALSRLWYHIPSRRRRRLLWLVLVMICTSLAEVVSIGAILPFLGALMAPDRIFESDIAKPIINMLGYDRSVQLLFPLTVLFIVAALLSGIMRIILVWMQTRLGFSIGADFSIQIYNNTLYQDYVVHASRNSSQIISVISTKTDTVINYVLLPLLYVISSTLILIAIMAALVIINPVVALVVFCGLGSFYGLIIFSAKKRLKLYSAQVSNESGRVIKALQEGLGGIRDVLIDGTQSVYCKIYKDADLPLRRSQANIQIIGAAPRFLVEAFGMSFIAVFAYTLTKGDGVAGAIPVLGALAIGAQRLLPVLQLIYWSISNIRGHANSLNDVLDLLEQGAPNDVDNAFFQPIPYIEKLRVRNVSFRYAESGPWILKGVDFEIPKGGRVGFIGSTGSGKSTLLDLIMGLLQPTEGVLEVDGVVITSSNNRAWQSHIAHVPQSIFLTDATIAENIAFGVLPKNIDLERVRFAARKAQIADVVESWHDQYDTLVGERGMRLSGGQRQRIGIARALYKRADIIVFDEATSALDGSTEIAVMDDIDQSGRDITILMVAHRLTTLQKCDLIFELEGGRIKKIGRYEDMVKLKNGVDA